MVSVEEWLRKRSDSATHRSRSGALSPSRSSLRYRVLRFEAATASQKIASTAKNGNEIKTARAANAAFQRKNHANNKKNITAGTASTIDNNTATPCAWTLLLRLSHGERWSHSTAPVIYSRPHPQVYLSGPIGCQV